MSNEQQCASEWGKDQYLKTAPNNSFDRSGGSASRLKAGDKMDLYLISIGAYQGREGIDCVLLVEEFQKPAA